MLNKKKMLNINKRRLRTEVIKYNYVNIMQMLKSFAIKFLHWLKDFHSKILGLHYKKKSDKDLLDMIL